MVDDTINLCNTNTSPVVIHSAHSDSKVRSTTNDDETSSTSSSILKSRGDLKRELLSSVPHGAELQYLQDAEQQLLCMQDELRLLEEKRGSLRRAMTIRERKLRDWKGKIPRRTGEIPRVVTFEQGQQVVGCVAIANLDNDIVQVHARYATALEGLAGFDKAWLLLLITKAESQMEVQWILVDVVHVDTKAKVLRIGLEKTIREREWENGFKGMKVLDIKPYLPYCEAWPVQKDDDDEGR